MRFFPKMVAISSRASVSSLLAKKGNLRVKKHRRVTPTDQMSRAMSSKHRQSMPQAQQVDSDAHPSSDQGISEPPLVLGILLCQLDLHV